MGERLAYVEKLLGDSADKHADELQAIKASHGKHAEDLAALAKAHEVHATLPERIAFLERAIGYSANKHAKEIQALRDAHGGHARALKEHHATVEERMQYVEKLLGDSADKHAQELKALKTAHERHAGDMLQGLKGLQGLQAHHASLPERMDYLEQVLGDSADKHAKELADIRAAHAKFAEAHGKHAKDLEGLKRIHAHHATLQERIDYLEKNIGDSADKHFEELQNLKSLHAKHADALAKHGKDASAALSAHATISERIAFIEKAIGDSADKHLAAVAEMQNKHGSTVKDVASIRESYTQLANGLQDAQAKNVTLDKRLDLFESRLRTCFSA